MADIWLFSAAEDDVVDEKMPFSMAVKARACGLPVNRAAWTIGGLPIRGGRITVEEHGTRLRILVTAADERTTTFDKPRRWMRRVLDLTNYLVVHNIADLATE